MSKEQNKKAVVLLSGGLDSAVSLAVALSHDECKEIYPISIQYGQKHEARELESAISIVTFYDHLLLENDPRTNTIVHPLRQHTIEDVFQKSKSALIDPEVEQLKLSYEELGKLEGPAQTVVPFRNANLISVATSYAVIVEADYVYVGVHATDSHHWAYPDCSPEFIGAMANAVYVGSYHQVRLRAPLQYYTKTEVVEVGRRLHVPFARTYSCYVGGAKHCGTCPTCIERINAFRENYMTDYADYEIPVEWRFEGLANAPC